MLFFVPRGVLDEILNLIESVSEGFPSYFFNTKPFFQEKLHAIMISYLLSVHCQELSSIPNGLYNLTTDSTSTYASYSCGVKYYINGPSVRKCLDSGLWDGIDPRCGKKIS